MSVGLACFKNVFFLKPQHYTLSLAEPWTKVMMFVKGRCVRDSLTDKFTTHVM